MNNTQRLVQIDATLASIPTFACKPGCSACCGPVLMSRLEWKRICARLGYDMSTPQPADTILANMIDANHLDCPMLKDGQCSVYDIRPAICRLFGAASDKMLECPKGCRPETYMDGADAGAMLREVGRLGR